MNYNEAFSALCNRVDKYLKGYFDRLLVEIPEKKLIQSMGYSALAGGKRIRPVLSLAVAKMLDISVDSVIPIAAAIEMIHTYSLIHDDLPAMDDDDYRRGKLTNHKVYGEAMAILAGDALLNEAFELLLKVSMDSGSNKHAVEAAFIVATAAGKGGMIGGQVIDMESEGVEVSPELLTQLHRKKTGALLKASILAPAAYGGASSEARKALEEYADCIGIAFQIKDDILDVESSLEALGKPVGSDAKNHKTTYVSLYGMEPAKEKLQDITVKAVQALSLFGEKAWFLKETANFIATRTH